MAMRILVTGASGFIGTNLVESLLQKQHEVLNLDIQEPRHPDHHHVYCRADILDASAVCKLFDEFEPTHVVHLAARTDLDETVGLDGYRANTDGVRNVVDAVRKQPSVKRALFTSTKLVCPTDAKVVDENDYRPDTVYGKSKVLGERIVKQDLADWESWSIVRPTSIWGPWCDIPYGRFFRIVKRGLYFHPGRVDPPRSFGYVGNAVYQIESLLQAPADEIHGHVFYLSDYEPFTIREWANAISMALRDRPAATIPEPLVRLLAWCGDLLKACGVREPPITSFRLRNMRAVTTGVPIDWTRRITGPLPFSMNAGVHETLLWLDSCEDRSSTPRAAA